MVKFILKRLMYGFLVLLGVITVIFLLFNVLPGDPARMMLGQRADQVSIDAINKDLGRDKPLTTQFLMYLNDLSPVSVHDPVNKDHYLYLNPDKYSSYVRLFPVSHTKIMVLKYPYLRRSYITKRKVSDIIKETLPETTVLALSSITFGAFFGILLGIWSAIKKNSWFDKGSLIFAIFGMALPSFFVGLIIAWFFGFILRDYTGLSHVGSLYTTDDFGDEHLTLKNLILPTLTLGLRPLAIIIQLTRSSLLDVLSQDYIRTATAKGLSFYKVVFKHALKNALNPVITAVSGWFAGLMAGAVFVEIIFNWKGIGYEVVDALNKNDLPVVMGATLVFAVIFVVINIAVDIIYGILDPRVRFSKDQSHSISMKNPIFISLLFVLIVSAGSAQRSDKYAQLTKNAMSYYEAKEYKRSANTYSEAFKSNSWKGYRADRYNAACAWALAGNKDSAFYQLFKVANSFKYDNYDRLSKDSVLITLNKDPRWEQLLNIVKQNIGQDEARLNKSLVVLLDSVYRDDQTFRFKQISINKEFGINSPEGLAIKKLIREKDSVNSFVVTGLLDKYGWISKEVAGTNGNSTLALVLQHSTLEVQKKYLPLMREAVKNNKAEADDLALVEDRAALAEGKKQIYGTQLISFDGKNYHFLPIEDPENIDKKRMQSGLGTMDEYVKNWGLRWNLKKYEEDLKFLEKEKVSY